MRKEWSAFVIGVWFSLCLSCGASFGESIPEYKLTKDERVHEFQALVNLIRRNYALDAFKEKKFKFKIESLVNKYRRAIQRNSHKDNSTFYHLMQKFVAEFRDAHFGIFFPSGNRRGVAVIAYLGIEVVREDEDLWVKGYLPTIDPDSANFPIQPGDRIIAIDGKTVRTYIDAQMTPYRNLGNDESNFTYHAASVFQRLSTEMPLPEKDSVKLKILRDEQTIEVKLNWVRLDYQDFRREQQEATTEEEDAEEHTPLEKFQMERDISSAAIFIEEANSFPAYILPRLVQLSDTFELPAPVGVIRIPTFSPEAEADQVLAELQLTLVRFQSFGVRDIVIDLLDNGGGSISLFAHTVQAFSPTPIKLPRRRLGTVQGWLDYLALEGADHGDDHREALHKKLEAIVRAAKEKGQTLTRPIELRDIIWGHLEPNRYIDRAFNLAVLIDERCASSADNFAHTIRANKMGILIGQQTVGAGGNVGVHRQGGALTNFSVSLTESLNLMGNTPIENNGAKPHVPLVVSRYVAEKYQTVYDLAIEKLLQNRTKALRRSCHELIASNDA